MDIIDKSNYKEKDNCNFKNQKSILTLVVFSITRYIPFIIHLDIVICINSYNSCNIVIQFRSFL